MSEQTQNPTPPAGHRMDAFGRLVAEDNIKPIDLARDELVREIAANAKRLNQELVRFKKKTFEDIQALIDLSFEKYKVKVGGGDGNVQLLSFDGRYKVQRAVQKYIRFDERLLAAKALIDECLSDWTKDARAELHTLVNDVFQVDKEGNISTTRVLSLRRLKINDPRWADAMTALSDAVQVTGSKSYVRIYERDADGVAKQIALDVANA